MHKSLAPLLVVALLVGGAAMSSAEGEPPLTPRVYLPLVARSYRSGPAPLLLSALYYDTYRTGEPDEAFQLYNPLETPVDLEAWHVSDRSRTVSFPAGINLDARTKLWYARRAVSFTVTLGFKLDCEYGGDTDSKVPDLVGTALQFGNTGHRVTLLHP